MAMVLSEGNMSLKNLVTPPGIDPGTNLPNNIIFQTRKSTFELL
jgi:hypothetical protein